MLVFVKAGATPYLSYARKHWLACSAVIYLAIAVMLRAWFGIDVCPPCIWNTLFDIHCPGCGFTTALASLLKLDIVGSIDHHLLAIPITFAAAYYFFTDLKMHIHSTSNQF